MKNNNPRSFLDYETFIGNHLGFHDIEILNQMYAVCQLQASVCLFRNHLHANVSKYVCPSPKAVYHSHEMKS